jgi:hypothetical protein
MTEAEWLTCVNPSDMLLRLPSERESERKVILLLVAAASGDEYSLQTRSICEGLARYVEGLIPRGELDGIYRSSGVEWRTPVRFTAENARYSIATSREGRLRGCRLIRDIFGNPFRPVTADPSWLSSTVVALAEGIYADRAFDRLPILADALQDAGCDDAEVLDHCRGGGTHVRGCWVVDLLLGKE